MGTLGSNLLGITFLLITFLLILLASNEFIKIKKILLVAFILRALLVIIEQFGLVRLPDGNSIASDAYSFVKWAKIFSDQKGLSVLIDFYVQDSKLISRIISIFYTLFGESVMMARIISVVLGTSSVYLIYSLCLRIWNKRSAEKAAWLTAVFPSLALYSAITLREVYVVFFLLISLIGVAKYFENKSITSLFQVIFGFYMLSLFHGPAALGGFVFLLYLILDKIKFFISKLKFFKINLSILGLIIIFITPVILFINFNIKFPYLGSFQDLTDLTNLKQVANYGFRGEASYPNWLAINENNELIIKTILRVVYFLYSPFFWDIKKFSYLIGSIDGIFYFTLTIYLIMNWPNIWANPTTRVFVLMFIVYLIVYAFGSANFGQAFRHRSKFVVILIILAAPKIHKFVFSFKKHYIR